MSQEMDHVSIALSTLAKIRLATGFVLFSNMLYVVVRYVIVDLMFSKCYPFSIVITGRQRSLLRIYDMSLLKKATAESIVIIAS